MSLPGREQERARLSRLAAGCAADGRWICAEPPHLPLDHRPASRPRTMSAQAAQHQRLTCTWTAPHMQAGRTPGSCPAEMLMDAEHLHSFWTHDRSVQIPPSCPAKTRIQQTAPRAARPQHPTQGRTFMRLSAWRAAALRGLCSALSSACMRCAMAASLSTLAYRQV